MQRQLLAQMQAVTVSPAGERKGSTLGADVAPVAGAVYVSRVARARQANAVKRESQAVRNSQAGPSASSPVPVQVTVIPES